MKKQSQRLLRYVKKNTERQKRYYHGLKECAQTDPDATAQYAEWQEKRRKQNLNSYYELKEGMNRTIFTNSNSAKFASDADFIKFDHVEADGRTVAKKYYTSESGSTVITFNQDYIKTLQTGAHTLTIVSTDGSASTGFTVSVPLPPTGDRAHPALLIMLLFASVGTILLTSARARKRNED